MPDEKLAPDLTSQAALTGILPILGYAGVAALVTQEDSDALEFCEQHIPLIARVNCRYRATGFASIGGSPSVQVLENVILFNHEVICDVQHLTAPVGGHVLTLIGFDSDRQVFTAKNQWGKNAFIEIAYQNVRPFLLPTVVAEEVAQGEHGVDVATLPMHAGALEPGFDDQLVGTLDHAAADGPALLAEAGILQLCLALLEVGKVRPERLVVRVQLAQAAQLDQQWPWSLGLQALLPVLGPGHGVGHRISATGSATVSLPSWPHSACATAAMCWAAWAKSRIRTAWGQ